MFHMVIAIVNNNDSQYIYIYIYIYISMYKWINHDQSARQQGAIYTLFSEGIKYNMIDATNFMLGNLRSIFLPTKTKRFYK